MKNIAFSIKSFATVAFTLLVVGCTSDNVVDNNDNTQGGIKRAKGVVVFNGGTAETDSVSPFSRTSISHVQNSGATPVWSTGDKIWVKDKNGTFRQSVAGTFNTAKTRGSFAITGAYNNGCQINYVGNSSDGTKVTIATTQTQNAVNNFSHAGASGDCGVATGTSNGTDFNFTLRHKASYLCFMPRCMNSKLGPNIFLQKITITANKPIAGVYDFANGSLAGKTPVSGSSNTITLNTNNFTLNTTASSVAKNGAYVVIAPGTYNLTVTYTIKDPTTAVTVDIVKTLTGFVCNEGKIKDVSAWIDKDIKDYSSTKYYMWDAQQNYWYQHEWTAASNVWQPSVNGATNNNYPTASDAARYFSNVSYPTAASKSCKDCPNVNEARWYVERGAHHWDGTTFWTTMGHLYKGGLWLKKLDKIAQQYGKTVAQLKQAAPNGTNYATSGTAPSVDVAPLQGNLSSNSDFFYLPALGYYKDGKLIGTGQEAYFWLSTPSFLSGKAYNIGFNKVNVTLGNIGRNSGFLVRKFE